MNLVEAIEKDLIIVPVKGTDKNSVLEELVTCLCKVKNFDKAEVMEAILDREKLGSTAIGNGVAIPHCKMENVKGVNLVIGVSPNTIDYDDSEVRLFFLVVANNDEATSHVQLLSSIARFCSSSVLRNMLAASKTAKEVMLTINN